MKKKDLVSIILPTYNSAKTLKVTLNSIVNQTYSFFELIIVDDGSVDNTEEICKDYLHDRRVGYYKIKNGGVSKARNYGLTVATGKYVTFIDSDDMYLSTFIETMIEKISNKYELVTCGYQNFEKNNKVFLQNIDIDSLKNYDKRQYIEILQQSFLFNQIWNKIYLLSIIRNNKISFNENLSIAEDLDFNLNYLSIISKFTICNNVLYLYRITDTGLGFKYRNDANKIKIDLLKKMDNLFFENKFSNYMSKNYIRQYFSYFSNIIDKRNVLTYKVKKKKIKEIIFSKEYDEIIKKVKVKGIIYHILLICLKSKSIYLIIFLSILANKYDKLQKKEKFGL